MNIEHMHNMTDVEFIRVNEHTIDPLLQQALTRIDRLISALHACDTMEDLDDLKEQL